MNLVQMYKQMYKNERGYYFVTFYDGPHGYRETILWVHHIFVPTEGKDMNKKLAFPVQKAQVVITPKGTLVLRPGKGVVYVAEIASGYRGSAEIESIENGQIVAKGFCFRSGLGALGKTAWAIVNASERIKVLGWRTGRRVSQKNVGFYLYPNGAKEAIVNDELAELL